MIFRQLFDPVSCTYTYLIAARRGGEAVIVDPVAERADRYLTLIRELDLKLVKAVDTHVHADHLSGLGVLRDRTHCVTVMGARSAVDVVSMRVDDGETVEVEGLSLRAIYTPGHSDDSYCFVGEDRVLTGDTLLIRGTGRTDFQNGDPRAAYDSLFNRVLKLPDHFAVYPGHDYNGNTVSTIAEERAFNPRLQVRSADAYAALMNALHLPSPKMMDIAVPANLAIGFKAGDHGLGAATLGVAEARGLLGRPEAVFVDLREAAERRKTGALPGALHLPYATLGDQLAPGGLLRALCGSGGRQLVFYCAFGERSALALQAAREAGLDAVRHLGGGMDAWRKAGGAQVPVA